MTLCRLLCDFLNVFPNIRCLMCCHWDPRVDNSVMGGFCDQRALCFPFAFCSPAPVEAVKSKDVTRDHRHKRSRNLSLPPGGMIRVFPGWMELHKICSLILKQESHKSAWAAATTQRFEPFSASSFHLVKTSCNDSQQTFQSQQIVKDGIFRLKRPLWPEPCSAQFFKLRLSLYLQRLCAGLSQLFLASSTFPNKGGRLGFFVSLSFPSIPPASHSTGLAGASLESGPKSLRK